jgi:hypothetical protein
LIPDLDGPRGQEVNEALLDLARAASKVRGQLDESFPPTEPPDKDEVLLVLSLVQTGLNNAWSSLSATQERIGRLMERIASPMPDKESDASWDALSERERILLSRLNGCGGRS